MKDEPTNQEILKAVTTGFAKAEERFSRIDSRVGGIENRMGGIEARLGALEGRFTELEKQGREGFRGLHAEIVDLPDKIDDTYGSMLNDHEDRLRALEA